MEIDSVYAITLAAGFMLAGLWPSLIQYIREWSKDEATRRLAMGASASFFDSRSIKNKFN